MTRFALCTELWSDRRPTILHVYDDATEAITGFSRQATANGADKFTLFEPSCLYDRSYILAGSDPDGERMIGLMPLDGYIRCYSSAPPEYDYGYTITTLETVEDGRKRVVYVPRVHFEHQQGRNWSGMHDLTTMEIV